jgi:hypothetical protein
MTQNRGPILPLGGSTFGSSTFGGNTLGGGTLGGSTLFGSQPSPFSHNNRGRNYNVSTEIT